MKYSKLMLSAAAAVGTILGVGAASAADLPVKARPYAAPIPVFSWTGCYIGVHGGGGAMRDNFTAQLSDNENSANGTGGLAGGQIGCNYQDGNWVFGAEGEGWWSGIRGKSSSLNNEGFGETFTTKNKYDFSIAARAGIAFDRTLVYGTAGWVWGKFDLNFTETSSCCSFFEGPFVQTSTASATLNGLLLGLGIEHAITPNWTVKAEYNYLRFGSRDFAFTTCRNDFAPSVVCFADGSQTYRADKQLFKIGVNYLFNVGKAPLVANY
jgi:outer membrane immunogenic protein